MPDTILLNPDFEGGFRYHENIGELQVANEWMPWYLETEGLHRPEYKAETRQTGSGRVYEGDFAQKMFTTFSAHDAGLSQRVSVEPGSWYKFTGWVYVWSSKQDDPNASFEPGKYRAMLGANPWGHWATQYATIWGQEQPQDQYDRWVFLEVIFQAWHNEISLFTRGYPEWNVKHNDSYWDDLSIEEIAAPGQEPPPTPGPVPPPPVPPPTGDYGQLVAAIQQMHVDGLEAHAEAHRALANVLEQEATVYSGLRKESFITKLTKCLTRRSQ